MRDSPDIAALIDDRPAEGVFRVHADAFRRREIFELEMRHIFEATWVFVGLECQIPNPHDFVTAMIGRQPVIVSRGADGALHCLLNACRHRGAMVCVMRQGNRKTHVCPYHAWTYDSAGRNIGVTNESEGAYAASFAGENRDLRPAGRVASYRGFIFASLNPDVTPLEAHLGDARTFIDLAVDQGPQGLELVPGTVTYTYNGNWKMQTENGQDSYHFIPTHASYLHILGQRQPGAAGEPTTSAWRNFSVRNLDRGNFTFAGGHNVLWSAIDDPEMRAIWLEREAVRKRVGEVRLKWMLHTRNLLVFPNFQLLDASSLQIRINRPLAPDRTEITTYCVAPIGESREARLRRLRQYEEFYNPSGLATPDDVAVFDACQSGPQSDWIDWNFGYLRGLADLQQGPNAFAAELGIAPLTAVSTTAARGDETLFHPQYREWVRLLEKGQARDRAADPARRAAGR